MGRSLDIHHFWLFPFFSHIKSPPKIAMFHRTLAIYRFRAKKSHNFKCSKQLLRWCPFKNEPSEKIINCNDFLFIIALHSKIDFHETHLWCGFEPFNWPTNQCYWTNAIRLYKMIFVRNHRGVRSKFPLIFLEHESSSKGEGRRRLLSSIANFVEWPLHQFSVKGDELWIS